MARRTLLIAAVCTLLLPAASGANGRVITDRDTGRTFTVRRGAELALRLSNHYRWTEPRTRGTAVRLTPVEYFVDPGYLEWEIHARTRGTARVTALGRADSGAERPFRVVIVVR